MSRAPIYNYFGEGIPDGKGNYHYECLECKKNGKSNKYSAAGKTTSNLINHLNTNAHRLAYEEYLVLQKQHQMPTTPVHAYKKRKLFEPAGSTPPPPSDSTPGGAKSTPGGSKSTPGGTKYDIRT
jgi:hypothetical protein